MLQTAVVGALATFAVTLLLTPAMAPLARRWGLVDRPEGRRWHAAATPAVGGLAILVAASAIGLIFFPMTRVIEGFGLAAVVIVAAGVADDLFRIRWQYRLGAQVLAALIMIAVAGIRVDNIGAVFGWPIYHLGAASIPLTVLATVGIVNAVNMADGIDGLAGAMSLVAIAMLTAAATYAGNVELARNLALLAGALAAFLFFNLRTPWRRSAAIFLGNSGAELLGLVIAGACFRLTQNPHHPVGAQLAPFLIAPALIDCLVLMVRRAKSGHSPFEGDREHLHHLLLEAGLGPSQIVAVITGATLLIGGAAALALRLHMPAPLFTVAFVVMLVGYFVATHSHEGSVERLATLARWVGMTRGASLKSATVLNFPHTPAAAPEPKARRRAF